MEKIVTLVDLKGSTNKDRLKQICNDFRKWNREWDNYQSYLFNNIVEPFKPISVEEFIKELDSKYTIKLKKK